MKKQIGKKLRTNQGDLAEACTELGLAELRLVTGAGNRRIGGGGLGGGGFGGIGVIDGGATSTTTYPGSITNPGESDTQTDTTTD